MLAEEDVGGHRRQTGREEGNRSAKLQPHCTPLQLVLSLSCHSELFSKPAFLPWVSLMMFSATISPSISPASPSWGSNTFPHRCSRLKSYSSWSLWLSTGSPPGTSRVLSTSQVHYCILKHTLILFISDDFSQICLIFSTSPILDLAMAVDSYFFKVLALLVFLPRSRPNLKSFSLPSSAPLSEFFHPPQLYPGETLFIEQHPTMSFGSALTASQSYHSGQKETFTE